MLNNILKLEPLITEVEPFIIEELKPFNIKLEPLVTGELPQLVKEGELKPFV